MKITIYNRIITSIALAILTLSLNSCGTTIWNPADVKDSPINDADKRKKNIDEGRGVRNIFGNKKNSGTFQFASSNALWRATIDVLDFTPLSNVDYGGGIVITDWYSDGQSLDESIKITVQFLSNEIRADAISVKIHKKECQNNTACRINEIKTELNQEIKLAILKKAALIKKNDFKKVVEENGEYRVTPIKDKKKK
jgi:hypothetical protein